MSEFRGIAEHIAAQLAESEFNDGVGVDDIVNIVGHSIPGERFNCYPGVPGGRCHEFAMFFSFVLKKNRGKKRGHLTCRKVIEKLVQHMQGPCGDTTRYAVLVVDSWDGEAADEWWGNIKMIRHRAHLEVYLVTNGAISPISV